MKIKLRIEEMLLKDRRELQKNKEKNLIRNKENIRKYMKECNMKSEVQKMIFGGQS